LIGLLALIGYAIFADGAIAIVDTLMAGVVLTNRLIWRTGVGFGLGSRRTLHAGAIGTIPLERSRACVLLDTSIPIILPNGCLVSTLDTLMLIAVRLFVPVFGDTALVVFAHGIGVTLATTPIKAVIESRGGLTNARKACPKALYANIGGIAVRTGFVFCLALCRELIWGITRHTAILFTERTSGRVCLTRAIRRSCLARVLALRTAKIDTRAATTFGVALVEYSATLYTFVVFAVRQATIDLLASAVLCVCLMLALDALVPRAKRRGRRPLRVIWVTLRCPLCQPCRAPITARTTLVFRTIGFVTCLVAAGLAINPFGVAVGTRHIRALVVGTKLPIWTMDITCAVPLFATLLDAHFVHARHSTKARLCRGLVGTPVRW
jgi:hypothetical protein